MRNFLRDLYEHWADSRFVRAGTYVYAGGSLIIVLYILFNYVASTLTQSAPTAAQAVFLSQKCIWIMTGWIALSLPLTALMVRKCHFCRSQGADKINAVLKEMELGHLGWKLTLSRGQELEELAQSVSSVNTKFAERLEKIHDRSQDLFEIEDYLVDAIKSDGRMRPATMKALRKLKIYTSRLKADIEDFDITHSESIDS